MRLLNPFFLFLFGLMLSCGPTKINEGELEYAVSYPYAQISGFGLSLLPEKITTIFKGTKVMTTIKKGKFFTTQIISDEADKSIEMRLLFGNEKLFYTILSPQDIDKLKASQPTYTISPTDDSDSLKGLWAKRYEVKGTNDSIINGDVWFTEDLTPNDAYWFTSYSSIKGMPLVYDVERYNVFMHIEISKFKQREVKENEFERDPKLILISFDEYEAETQALFDLIMK